MTFEAANVVIICALALATVPELPVGEMNSISEGVCCRNSMGMPLRSHCLTKWAPLTAAGAFSSPLLDIIPTRKLKKGKKDKNQLEYPSHNYTQFNHHTVFYVLLIGTNYNPFL